MPELSFNPLRTPFDQAVANLQARIPRGLKSEQLAKIQGGGRPRADAHWNWHDTLAHQHASSFVVARMAEGDLLKAVHTSLTRAQKEGWSFERWSKSITPELKSAGWWGKQEKLNPKTGKMELVQLGSPRRLKTIYRTNMRVSMMAAHYESMKEASKLLPLWRYVAVLDERTRPSHAALHNKVFPHDHPFWDTHFPPNGWMCRCTVVAESATSLERLEEEIRTAPAGEGAGTAAESAPEIVSDEEVPTITQERIPGQVSPQDLAEGTNQKVAPVASFRGVRPDAGWSHNPGQMLWARETMLVDRIRSMPEDLARVMIDKMARSDYSPWSALVTATRQQFELFEGLRWNRKDSTGAVPDDFVVRWVPSELVQALRKVLGVDDLAPLLTTSQTSAWHLVRPTKNRNAQGSKLLPWAEYLKLPRHLADATDVFLDRQSKGVVVFSSPAPGGQLIKTVFEVRSAGGQQTLGLVTSGLVNPDAFRDARRWSRVNWSRASKGER